MPLKSKLYCIYTIKETNSRLIHLCVNEQNELLVSFSTKTYFDEDISCDLKVNIYPYTCFYENHNYEDFKSIVIKNSAKSSDGDLKVVNNELLWLEILGELLYNSKQQKISNFNQIMTFISLNDNEMQNVYILFKIILMLIKKNLGIDYIHPYKEEEEKLIKNNYDIIYKEVSLKLVSAILLQYYDILEQYGLELYSLKNLAWRNFEKI